MQRMKGLIVTDFETLTFTQVGSVVRIVLDRPAAANGMNPTMARELASAAAHCDTTRIKVVTLTGAGRFFCAGGDLRAMAEADNPGVLVKSMANNLHQAMTTFARMDAVLITAVNGVAAGAGFSLGVSGDLVLAAESASFTMAYTKAGLSPDGGASYVLPRLIGLRRTQELMITNRVLTALQALDWGLVTSVVRDTDLPGALDNVAAQIASGASRSNSAVKELLLGTYRASYEEQLENEARLIAANASAADGREGIAAFLAKRTPEFN